MPRSRGRSRYYYYASGQPVDLILDLAWLAIDTRKFQAARISSRSQASILKDARPLKNELVLVKHQSLPAKERDALTALGAVQPVFRADGAIMIALPEVRVEERSIEIQRALHRWISDHADETELVSDDGDRILLCPTSGQGVDAISLANRLTEQVGPEMAQPRFLRVVEHPGNARSPY